MTLYLPPHLRQYDFSAITRSSGCTWTSAAMGANASSGGKIARTPDQVHALVKSSEETSPATPGWSLPDVKLAMSRIKVGFEVRSGRGWAAVEAALDAGHYVVLQGDSDQFSDATCSGAFNGDHAIGVHPVRDSKGRQLINDPICKVARYETRAVLRGYAQKLSSSVRFGVFTTKVPQLESDMPVLYFKPDLPPVTGTANLKGTDLAVFAHDGRRFPRANGEAYTVYAAGTLHDIGGKPIDVEQNQPPRNGRERVYSVDRPEWGNACYVPRADVTFTADVAEAVVPPSAIACKPYVDAALTDAVVEHRIVPKEV